jgi:hypothetical protein
MWLKAVLRQKFCHELIDCLPHGTIVLNAEDPKVVVNGRGHNHSKSVKLFFGPVLVRFNIECWRGWLLSWHGSSFLVVDS